VAGPNETGDEEYSKKGTGARPLGNGGESYKILEEGKLFASEERRDERRTRSPPLHVRWRTGGRRAFLGAAA